MIEELGVFGGHRFYMRENNTAVAMLVITLVSIPLFFVLIGFATYFCIVVWWIVDAFLLHEWVKQHNVQLMHQLGMMQTQPQAGLPEQSTISQREAEPPHSA